MRLSILTAVLILTLIIARLYMGEPRSMAMALGWLGAALLLAALLFVLRRLEKKGNHD